jgi:hypothetical protein
MRRAPCYLEVVYPFKTEHPVVFDPRKDYLENLLFCTNILAIKGRESQEQVWIVLEWAVMAL